MGLGLGPVLGLGMGFGLGFGLGLGPTSFCASKMACTPAMYRCDVGLRSGLRSVTLPAAPA